VRAKHRLFSVVIAESIPCHVFVEYKDSIQQELKLNSHEGTTYGSTLSSTYSDDARYLLSTIRLMFFSIAIIAVSLRAANHSADTNSHTASGLAAFVEQLDGW
jgi:hypothetical protein